MTTISDERIAAAKVALEKRLSPDAQALIADHPLNACTAGIFDITPVRRMTSQQIRRAWRINRELENAYFSALFTLLHAAEPGEELSRLEAAVGEWRQFEIAMRVTTQSAE